MMTPFEAYLESDQADDDFHFWSEQHGHRAEWERSAACSDTAQQWIDSEGDEHRLERAEVDRAEGLT